ncbi:MAG: hypothetical protein WDM91_12250 [Rhizomicrobium sp.]
MRQSWWYRARQYVKIASYGAFAMTGGVLFVVLIGGAIKGHIEIHPLGLLEALALILAICLLMPIALWGMVQIFSRTFGSKRRR